MVKICSDKYPSENEETFKDSFDKFSFPLSDFQKHAIEAVVTGNHVLVTAHTGSGKTLPAEFAIRHFVGKGKRVVYTSPIKALSNQKYYEFTKKYPDIRFGLFTGDIKTNPDADVLIMTTEILMNYLFTALNDSSSEDTSKPSLQFQIDVKTDLACVIFDEVHYINDQERGQTWEKTILMLPPHVQMVMLSATIDNPEGFAAWCERGQQDRQVYLATTTHRVVPLYHYGFITTSEAIFKIIKDKETQKMIRDGTNVLLPLKDHNGGFQEQGYRKIAKITDLHDKNSVRMTKKHVLNQIALLLRDREMLPAIAFVFSRKQVELCAKDITIPLLEFDSKVGYTVRYECEQIVRKLPNYAEYLALPEYNQLVSLLEKGIGIHHSGMIPILREIVELMISKKYIKLLFATESFAIGLDCPIRTAVFTSLTKFDGNTERHLHAHEYMQMAGRAGRRGIDTIGYVVHCNNLFSPPSTSDYTNILCGKPQKLISKYHISYNLILNLLKNGKTDGFADFSRKSMMLNEINRDIAACQSSFSDIQERIKRKTESVGMLRTQKSVCERYLFLESTVKTLVNKKRKEAEREIQKLLDENKYIVGDAKSIQELIALEQELDYIKSSIEQSETYISRQTDAICEIMKSEGFIESCDDGYKLSSMGKIASNVAEIHPLVLSNLMVEWNYFSEFSAKQLIGLFSIFTDVKVPEDIRAYRPIVDDPYLQSRISDVAAMYRHYDDLEIEKNLNTGIHYDSALNYDIIDFSIRWCECETESECKEFIQGAITEKSISIGDFTKAMLKIVTITNEFVNICEDIGAVELKYKLAQIERLVLKYVTTSQSLYV
jgi:superfamily II RNA helicase